MNEVKKLMDKIKEQCGDCEAWSGTDCTRNPYTQGCLKDEKQVDKLENRFENKACCNMSENCSMIQQAVKDTAKEILTELIEKAHSNGCIDLTVNEVKAWFREDYGVEVEE